MQCNIIIQYEPQNAQLLKQYFNIYDVFYMFQTQVFIFKKKVLHRGMVKFANVPMV